jgi:hypothetical protein
MAKRTLEEREKISKDKRGGNDIEVLQYVTPKQAKAMGFEEVLVPVLGENFFLGGLDDVETVMEENNMSGDFMPVRRPSGIITREAVVKVVKTDNGFKGPVVAEAPPAPLRDEKEEEA